MRAEFVEGARGRVFALFRAPPAESRGAVLVVPPFAEEMNKARRMVTDASRALLEVGFGSVCVDLYGTGDSEGEFRDASWDVWIADLSAAAARSTALGMPITRILATRLGCLLAADYLKQNPEVPRRCVFWQPVVDGARYIDQFLRLRLAASLFGGAQKETLSGLHSQLSGAGAVEVAGYMLSSGLAQTIGARRMSDLLANAGAAIDWIDVVRSPTSGVPTASLQAVETLCAGGNSVRSLQVVGEPFWASTETVVLPELSSLTAGLLSEGA